LGGEGSTAAFVAAARAQSSQNWRPEVSAAGLVAYIREGFEEPGAPPRDWRAPTPPTAAVSLPESVTTADTSLTFTVTYTDDKAVDVESEDQVKDTEGFTLPVQRIGKANLDVIQVPPPPVVTKVKFRGKKPQSFTARFSADVSATIKAADLLVTAEDGTAIDPAALSMTYDPELHAATWTFPGLANGALPAGRYHITLRAAVIADAAGRALDGNKDGVGGDDFAWPKVLKSKG
jgi:hypothetical protein